MGIRYLLKTDNHLDKVFWVCSGSVYISIYRSMDSDYRMHYHNVDSGFSLTESMPLEKALRESNRILGAISDENR